MNFPPVSTWAPTVYLTSNLRNKTTCCVCVLACNISQMRVCYGFKHERKLTRNNQTSEEGDTKSGSLITMAILENVPERIRKVRIFCYTPSPTFMMFCKRLIIISSHTFVTRGFAWPLTTAHVLLWLFLHHVCLPSTWPTCSIIRAKNVFQSESASASSRSRCS